MSILDQFKLPSIRESLQQYKEDDAALEEALYDLVSDNPGQWAGMCRGEVTIAATLPLLLELLEDEPNVPVRELDPKILDLDRGPYYLEAPDETFH